MDSPNKPRAPNGPPRRHSLTAHLTRSARRFSAAVAPQLTKLDAPPMLLAHQGLSIRLTDITQVQNAIEKYIVKNNVQFDTIDFDVIDINEMRVLNISLSSDEMVLADGTKRILSVTFEECEPEDNGTAIARIRHPLSGMRVFEFVEVSCSKEVRILSYVDQCDRCRIEPSTDSVFNFLSTCGCIFSRRRWQFRQDGRIFAEIKPNGTFFDENSLRLEWIPEADCELRLIVIAYGMTQMVREAFPQLKHIINEQNLRRNG